MILKYLASQIIMAGTILKRYKLIEYYEVNRLCRKIFGCEFPLKESLDSALTLFNGYVTLDILVVEQFFYRKGMSDKESMEEFAIRKYGEKGSELIKSLVL